MIKGLRVRHGWMLLALQWQIKHFALAASSVHARQQLLRLCRGLPAPVILCDLCQHRGHSTLSEAWRRVG
jgi:hypothetical protein